MIAPSSNSIQQQQVHPNDDLARGSDDSDSDWDDDDDFIAKKINIKIKPIAQLTPNKISASVDELRATVGTWKSMANINLVKPNSRRSIHQSTLQLNRVSINENNNILETQKPLQPIKPTISSLNVAAHAEQPKLASIPVAFAIQECLNVRTLVSSEGFSATSLIGRIKMAVPKCLAESDSSNFQDNDLVVDIISTQPWSCHKTNDQFIRRLEHDDRSNIKKLFVDMGLIYSYARQFYQKQPESRYFLLPELLNYNIRSHDNDTDDQFGSPDISPIRAVAHWLCDLSVTKVRVDLEFLEDSLDGSKIKPHDITNVKISFQVNGGVMSHQSKPEAVWSPIDSRLTWSFSNLSELTEMSTVNGITSCLAKMNLSDGPSTPSDMSIQFSINGKTISGTKLSLEKEDGLYKIVKQKHEVRTGTFRCEPPCLEIN